MQQRRLLSCGDRWAAAPLQERYVKLRNEVTRPMALIGAGAMLVLVR